MPMMLWLCLSFWRRWGHTVVGCFLSVRVPISKLKVLFRLATNNVKMLPNRGATIACISLVLMLMTAGWCRVGRGWVCLQFG